MRRILSVLLATIMLFSALSCLTMSVSALYDTMLSAKLITSGTTYNGNISRTDEEDYYKFTLSTSSSVNLSLNAPISELYITLYNTDGNQITSNEPGWNSGGQIVFNRTYVFTKGTYYIKISKGYWSDDANYGNYSFKINVTSSNETFEETLNENNNTIQTSDAISSGTTYKGQIAFNDLDDYYKFTLATSSTVDFNLNAPLSELYVTLYDADGNQIAYNEPGWNSGGQIVFNRTYVLIKGTYYLKISKGYWSDDVNFGNYSFKFTAVSSKETFGETLNDNNNLISTADSILEDKTYNGQIAFNDLDDYYKLTLSASASVNFSLTAPLSELYITLYDTDGNQIAYNEPDWNSGGQIVFYRIYALKKGTYYLKISKGYWSDDVNFGNYSFNYSLKASNETFEESVSDIDNSLATADKISVGKTYKGQIAINDLDDYYKFSVSSGTIDIKITSKISELYLWIYSENGSEIFRDTASSNDSGNISYAKQLSLSKGTYYLRISKGYWSDDNNYGNYTFTISKYVPPTSITSISNSTKGVTIKWSRVEGASGYYVYRKTSGGSYSKIKTVTSGSTVSYTDDNTKSGKTYYYYIKAYSGSSVSEKCSTAKIKRLSRPVLKTISNTEYGVLVKWAETTGAYGYKVYRKTSDGWKYLGKTTKAYFTDKTAKSGKKYTYTVRAYSGDFISSYNSSGISKYYLADPTLKTPTSTTSGIKLSWTKSAGAEGYIIYRKTGSGSYTKLKTEKGVSNLSYTDSSAKKSTKYTYKVKAYKSSTYSTYSNTKTITDKY